MLGLVLAFVGGVVVGVCAFIGLIVYADYRKWAGKSLREYPKRQRAAHPSACNTRMSLSPTPAFDRSQTFDHSPPSNLPGR